MENIAPPPESGRAPLHRCTLHLCSRRRANVALTNREQPSLSEGEWGGRGKSNKHVPGLCSGCRVTPFEPLREAKALRQGCRSHRAAVIIEGREGSPATFFPFCSASLEDMPPSGRQRTPRTPGFELLPSSRPFGPLGAPTHRLGDSCVFVLLQCSDLELCL